MISFMLNDEDNNKTNWESDHPPGLPSATDNDADRNDDGSAMTTEQASRVTDAQSIIADILKDAEDDLYGRDGNTNDSDLAGQRLQAMAGRLVGAFAQVASGLSLVIEAAKQKVENAEKNDALIEFQNQQEKKKQEESEEAKDSLEKALDENENIRKLEREREEWSRSPHRYGDVEMTGEEWVRFADTLQNSPWLKKQITDQMKKDGKSPTEADDIYKMMILRAQMQSIPESDWTPEMRELNERMKADPKLDADIQKYTKNAHDRIEAANSMARNDVTTSASAANRSDALTDADGSVPSEAGHPPTPSANLIMAEDRLFPSAPALTEQYRQAVVATDPLDAPKAPAQTASTTPPTPPGGGFDV